MWLPSSDHIRFLGKLSLAQCVALYGEILLHMAIWQSGHLAIAIHIAASALPTRHLWPTLTWSPGGFVTSAMTISRKVFVSK